MSVSFLVRLWWSVPLGALAAALIAHSPPAMAELSRDVKVLSHRSAERGVTFITELGNAPFPVGPDAVDHRGQPFWHGVEVSGQRFRRLDQNRYYTEAATYSDARVL